MRYLDNATFRKQKSALTRAINSGDPWKVARAVQAAVRHWEGTLVNGAVHSHPEPFCWPDDWHRWNIAFRDAVFASQRDYDIDTIPFVDDIRDLGALSDALL